MLSKKKIKKVVVNYVVIALAAIIYGIGTSLFSDVNDLAPGGFTGIAIGLNRITGLGIGMWFWLLNIPVVINAGGKGSRLDPYTRVLPKPLIPVGELPIIELIMKK